MYFFVLQTEQILNEYKIRALACHPDKHLDNPTSGKRPTCPTEYLTKLFMSFFIWHHFKAICLNVDNCMEK